MPHPVYSLLVVVTLAWACGGSSQGSPGAPSPDGTTLTVRDRQHINQLVRDLKGGAAVDEEALDHVVGRINAVSGFTVVLCGDLLGPLLSTELADLNVVALMLVTSAAALLEHPEYKDDLPSMAAASLHSVAQIYEHHVGRGGLRATPLDELAELRAQGGLDRWVHDSFSCPTTTAAVKALASKEPTDTDTVVIAPEDEYTDGAWGEPVKDPEQEAWVLGALVRISSADAAQSDFAGVVIVGPALWRQLLLRDVAEGRSEMASLGTVSTNMTPDGRPPMAMRTFEEKDLSKLTRHKTFVAIMAGLAKGRARPATAVERRLFYTLIPFEIKDEPLTVVEHDADRLVVAVSDGKILWIDLLSGYTPHGIHPPVVARTLLRSHQPGEIALQRVGGEDGLGRYVEGLMAAIDRVFVSESPNATAGLHIGVFARPEGPTEFWIDALGHKLPADTRAKLLKALKSAPSPKLTGGPLIFSMGLGLWGKTPSFPDLVSAWKGKNVPGQLIMPDDALRSVDGE